MTTNISLIHKSVFPLYETMYNENVYFSLYMKINMFVTHESVFFIIHRLV